MPVLAIVILSLLISRRFSNRLVMASNCFIRPGLPEFSNRLFRRWRFPYAKNAPQEMAGDLLAKVPLMFPLHFGHCEQAVDHLVMVGFTRKLRGHFVLLDVRALQSSCSVHRNEPAADVTEDPDRFSDHPEDELAYGPRPRAQLREQFLDEAPVMPFLGLNKQQPLALVRR